MSHSSELPLTFGIEIEFHAIVSPTDIVQYMVNFNHGYHHEREAVVHHLASELEGTGIKVHKEDSVYMRVSKQDFSKWSLKVLGSNIGYRNDDGDWQISLVLNSRVLVLDDMSYVADSHPPSRKHETGGIAEMRQVLEVLARSSIKCVPKKHCGFHVHIGMGKPYKHSGKTPPSEPFAFEALLNLGGLALAFEPCVHSLLEMHRGDNDYCKAPSATYLLAPKPITERLEFIHKESTRGGLFAIMNPEKSTYHALNFQHIPTGSTSKTKLTPIQSGTIEFRQHEGTLDPNECSAWVQLVAGLVRTAHIANIFSKLPRWGKAAERRDFTYNNLLEKIGKPHLVPFYSTRIDRIRNAPRSKTIEPPTEYSDSSFGSTLVSLPRVPKVEDPVTKAESRAIAALRKSLRTLSCRGSRRDSGSDCGDSGRENQRNTEQLGSRKQRDEKGKRERAKRYGHSAREAEVASIAFSPI